MHSTLPFQHTLRCRGQVWFLDPALPGPRGPCLFLLLPLPMLAKNIPSEGLLPPPSGLLGLVGCFRVHQWDQVCIWASQDRGQDKNSSFGSSHF